MKRDDTSTFQLTDLTQADDLEVCLGRDDMDIISADRELGTVTIIGSRSAFEQEFCQDHPVLYKAEADDRGNVVTTQVPGRKALKGHWL